MYMYIIIDSTCIWIHYNRYSKYTVTDTLLLLLLLLYSTLYLTGVSSSIGMLDFLGFISLLPFTGGTRDEERVCIPCIDGMLISGFLSSGDPPSCSYMYNNR